MSGLTRWCAFFVVNSAWQVFLLAGMGAVLARLCKGMSATFQCRLWSGALLLSISVPIVSTYLALHPVKVAPAAPTVAADRWLTPRPPEHGRLTMHFTEVPYGNPSWSVFAVITATLGCFVGLGATRLLWQIKRIRQVVKCSSPLVWFAGPTRKALQHNMREAKVLVCPELSVPVTVSWLSPIILVPPTFEAMPEEQQLSYVAHELAHVERMDFELNLLFEIVSLSLCFHPGVYWIKKQIAQCREEVCDEIAAEKTVGRTQYARLLLHLAQQAQERSGLGLALGISTTVLERRIMALLDPVRKSSRHHSLFIAFSASALVGVSIAALCFGLHPTSVQAAGVPAFAFDPSQTFDTLKPKAERKQAPDFTLVDSSGKPITLSAYKGKVVLLDFWATWCGGCKLEIPWYMEFDRKYRKDGLAVIGVSMDEKGWEAVRPFLAKKQDPETGGMIAMQYPIVIGNDAMAGRFGLTSMPMTLLIDKEGKIAVSHTGVVDKENFESNIRALLK